MVKNKANKRKYKINTSVAVSNIQRGAVYVELVLGMLFCVLFFAFLLPQIWEMQESGDSAAGASFAVQAVAENPENRRLLENTITGSYFRSNAEVLAQLNANVTQAQALGANNPTFAAVSVSAGVASAYEIAGPALTPADFVLLEQAEASATHLMFFKDGGGVSGALPALRQDVAAPVPSPGGSCEANCCGSSGNYCEVTTASANPMCSSSTVSLNCSSTNCSGCTGSLANCPADGEGFCCTTDAPPKIIFSITNNCPAADDDLFNLCPDTTDCTGCPGNMCFACSCI